MSERIQIDIRSLPVSCIIGVLTEERIRPQDVEVDVEIQLNSELNFSESKVTETLDWRIAADFVNNELVNGQFFLAEHAALTIARKLANFSGVEEAKITVRKLNVYRGSRSVSATATVENERN